MSHHLQLLVVNSEQLYPLNIGQSLYCATMIGIHSLSALVYQQMVCSQ
jgi:hypothetical protein